MYFVCSMVFVDLLLSIFTVEKNRCSLDIIKNHPFVNVCYICLFLKNVAVEI